MTDTLLVAVIAAGSALLGGLITGSLALLGQRMTLRTADKRAQDEAIERERTRFHAERRTLYADFLTAASAAGTAFKQTSLKRQRATHGDDAAPQLRLAVEPPPDAPMRLGQLQAAVEMIAGSSEVGKACSALADATRAALLLPEDPDPEQFKAAFWAVLSKESAARERFIEAANKELTDYPTF